MARGRIAGANLKDIRYEKFYLILFKRRDLTYIFCKNPTTGRFTFVPVERHRTDKLDEIGIQKYATQEEAQKVYNQIPQDLVFDGTMHIEIALNTMINPDVL